MEIVRATGRLHKRFCRNLRAARKLAGLTQQQVAQALGISQPRYAEIENGKHPPGLELMERLAAVLGIQPHELLDPDFAAELVS